MLQEEDEPALTPSEDFLDRATYIPLRLDQDKRRLLRLLEAALSVSEYTNEVSVVLQLCLLIECVLAEAAAYLPMP